MSVRAKFAIRSMEVVSTSVPKVTEEGKTEYVQGLLYTVRGSPVYGNGDPNHENTKFWHASPSGELSLAMVREETAHLFEIGKEYYVDFTPVE